MSTVEGLFFRFLPSLAGIIGGFLAGVKFGIYLGRRAGGGDR